MQTTQRPFSNEAFQSLSGEPAWKTIPSWYMVATQDHAIPRATEQFMAARAHATVVEVSASHVPMISQPEATTRLHPRSRPRGALIPPTLAFPVATSWPSIKTGQG